MATPDLESTRAAHATYASLLELGRRQQELVAGRRSCHFATDVAQAESSFAQAELARLQENARRRSGSEQGFETESTAVLLLERRVAQRLEVSHHNKEVACLRAKAAQCRLEAARCHVQQERLERQEIVPVPGGQAQTALAPGHRTAARAPSISIVASSLATAATPNAALREPLPEPPVPPPMTLMPPPVRQTATLFTERAGSALHANWDVAMRAVKAEAQEYWTRQVSEMDEQYGEEVEAWKTRLTKEVQEASDLAVVAKVEEISLAMDAQMQSEWEAKTAAAVAAARSEAVAEAMAEAEDVRLREAEAWKAKLVEAYAAAAADAVQSEQKAWAEVRAEASSEWRGRLAEMRTHHACVCRAHADEMAELKGELAEVIALRDVELAEARAEARAEVEAYYEGEMRRVETYYETYTAMYSSAPPPLSQVRRNEGGRHRPAEGHAGGEEGGGDCSGDCSGDCAEEPLVAKARRGGRESRVALVAPNLDDDWGEQQQHQLPGGEAGAAKEGRGPELQQLTPFLVRLASGTTSSSPHRARYLAAARSPRPGAETTLSNTPRQRLMDRMGERVRIAE